MGGTFVIAECGSTWRFGDGYDEVPGTTRDDTHLASAERLIRAVKACGADAVKFQWTSSATRLSERRGMGSDALKLYREYLEYPPEFLARLRGFCDAVGIEFMCTVYLPQDIPVIAPLVKRFKVSAYERSYDAFLMAHNGYTSKSKPVIVSCWKGQGHGLRHINYCRPIYCVSRYPTPIEDLGLSELLTHLDAESPFHGLSDHTTSTLTGALAVAAGATIVEKHVRLWGTPKDNPDFPHSLWASLDRCPFMEYVHNIREAERAMG